MHKINYSQVKDIFSSRSRTEGAFDKQITWCWRSQGANGMPRGEI